MVDRRPFEHGPLADPDERQVIFATLDSFRQYRRKTHFNITHRRRQNFYALPEKQWRKLAAYPFNLLETFASVDDALDHNADIADAILELALRTFGLPAEPQAGTPYDWHGTAKPSDMAKAHSTIRQFYRDWSHEGFVAEVEPLINIVQEDLASVSMLPQSDGRTHSLLVPGAGLGRVLFSLSLQGFDVEGNEISYHQLLASNFILNATVRAGQYKLYPFASTFTNHKRRADQLKEVLIPDIHPATSVSLRKNDTRGEDVAVGDMNMTAGDFLTSYSNLGHHGKFDAVISIYFIDTAPNLIRYIETVWSCLKEGGIWINIGPLLWHFDDRKVGGHEAHDDSVSVVEIPGSRSSTSSQELLESSDTGIAEPGSFELTDEEVLSLVENMGFEILKHSYVPLENGGYIQDPRSMVQNLFECSHWAARKTSRQTHSRQDT